MHATVITIHSTEDLSRWEQVQHEAIAPATYLDTSRQLSRRRLSSGCWTSEPWTGIVAQSQITCSWRLRRIRAARRTIRRATSEGESRSCVTCHLHPHSRVSNDRCQYYLALYSALPVTFKVSRERCFRRRFLAHHLFGVIQTPLEAKSDASSLIYHQIYRHQRSFQLCWCQSIFLPSLVDSSIGHREGQRYGDVEQRVRRGKD
jgi:hypothetical protein